MAAWMRSAVATVSVGPAGVNEERCAGGRDEESGLAAFDIDGIDEEMLAGDCAEAVGNGSRASEASKSSGRQRWEPSWLEMDGGAEKSWIGGDSHLRVVYRLGG